MKPLIVLLTTFVITLLISRIFSPVGSTSAATPATHAVPETHAVSAAPASPAIPAWNTPLAGNLAMCLMLFLTAFGHFKFTKGMVEMLPKTIPARKSLVYLTGIAEPLLGIALVIPQYRPVAGIALVALFISLLPANIYAATKHLDIEKATFTGPGPAYLWFRITLQFLFMAWVWYFSGIRYIFA